MVDMRNKLTKIVIEKIRYTLQGLVFDTMIPRNIRLAEVPFRGGAVITFDKNCTGARSYLELANEVLGHKISAGVASEESAEVKVVAGV